MDGLCVERGGDWRSGGGGRGKTGRCPAACAEATMPAGPATGGSRGGCGEGALPELPPRGRALALPFERNALADAQLPVHSGPSQSHSGGDAWPTMRQSCHTVCATPTHTVLGVRAVGYDTLQCDRRFQQIRRETTGKRGACRELGTTWVTRRATGLEGQSWG